MSAPVASSAVPPRRRRRWLWRVALLLLLLLVAAPLLAWWMMIRMPGESYTGPLPTDEPAVTRLADELRRHVTTLASEIGERNLRRYPQLMAAAGYVERELQAAGYQVERQQYEISGVACHNLIAELPGATRPAEIVVIGAHYDSALGTPGANDNASGTAALLALARQLADSQPERTVRFVAFTNEEAPYFQTEQMGSLVYARRCRAQDERITAMLSLETIGYFSETAGSQHYPEPLAAFYPDRGDFIGVIGNVGSRRLVRRVVRAFRGAARIPSEAGAMPGEMTGVGWSDHWSFWEAGYPAVMITDTAPFRYQYYHAPEDTPDKCDFPRMALVVEGIASVIRELAGAPAETQE